MISKWERAGGYVLGFFTYGLTEHIFRTSRRVMMIPCIPQRILQVGNKSRSCALPGDEACLLLLRTLNRIGNAVSFLWCLDYQSNLIMSIYFLPVALRAQVLLALPASPSGLDIFKLVV